jgi:hypothetical protein
VSECSFDIEVQPPPIFEVMFDLGQGAAGPPGDSHNAIRNYQIVASADGALTVTLPDSPSGQVYLFINGLLQSISSYAVAGTLVSLPGTLNIMVGDSIAFLFIV